MDEAPSIAAVHFHTKPLKTFDLVDYVCNRESNYLESNSHEKSQSLHRRMCTIYILGQNKTVQSFSDLIDEDVS